MASPDSFSRMRLKRGRVIGADDPAAVTTRRTAPRAQPQRCQCLACRSGALGAASAQIWGLRMANLFLSYDRDDAVQAQRIAAALEQHGHSVWWDRHIKGGTQYSKEIEQALNAADAVIVL